VDAPVTRGTDGDEIVEVPRARLVKPDGNNVVGVQAASRAAALLAYVMEARVDGWSLFARPATD
jgi:hypothetical protein